MAAASILVAAGKFDKRTSIKDEAIPGSDMSHVDLI